MHQALCNLPLQSLTAGSNNHQVEYAHHYIMKKYLTPSPASSKGQLTTYATIQHEIIASIKDRKKKEIKNEKNTDPQEVEAVQGAKKYGAS